MPKSLSHTEMTRASLGKSTIDTLRENSSRNSGLSVRHFTLVLNFRLIEEDEKQLVLNAPRFVSCKSLLQEKNMLSIDVHSTINANL